eukprot:1055928-Pyramimonas_sp.AAC.1
MTSQITHDLNGRQLSFGQRAGWGERHIRIAPNDVNVNGLGHEQTFKWGRALKIPTARTE